MRLALGFASGFAFMRIRIRKIKFPQKFCRMDSHKCESRDSHKRQILRIPKNWIRKTFKFFCLANPWIRKIPFCKSRVAENPEIVESMQILGFAWIRTFANPVLDSHGFAKLRIHANPLDSRIRGIRCESCFLRIPGFAEPW